MKPFYYGIVGLILGAVIGFLLGGGQTQYINKTEKREMGESTVWVWAVAFAIGGAVTGGKMAAKMEREEEENIKSESRTIEEKIEEQQERAENKLILVVKKTLGIWRFETDCFKEGRFWTAETKWTDKRNGTAYILKTERSVTGEVVTALNGKYIITHDGKTPNKDVIAVLHVKTRDKLFDRLMEKYVENAAFTIEKLYDLPDN
ncbi:MAG TPA: hypothetical protein VM935_20205 [Chitinophagaceae bacterium]|nr:hypothetical protein [Chitinophagaceae bacterium]